MKRQIGEKHVYICEYEQKFNIHKMQKILTNNLEVDSCHTKNM
jgi:hypothetical protein